MSVYRDMAYDAGARGDELEQMAAAIEEEAMRDYHRNQEQELDDESLLMRLSRINDDTRNRALLLECRDEIERLTAEVTIMREAAKTGVRCMEQRNEAYAEITQLIKQRDMWRDSYNELYEGGPVKVRIEQGALDEVGNSWHLGDTTSSRTWAAAKKWAKENYSQCTGNSDNE